MKKLKPGQPAPMSAEGLKHAMEQNQLPATATEQAIGGRPANPTPKPNPQAESVDQTRKPVQSEKPKKQKKAKVAPTIETIKVRRDFIEGDFARMGKELSVQQREIGELEAQLKSIKSEYKAKTDKITVEIDRLTNAINDGFVMSDVECVCLVAIDKDSKSAKKCFYRRDSGDFVKTEPTSLNGQLELFAVHPHPDKIERMLSRKIVQSAV